MQVFDATLSTHSGIELVTFTVSCLEKQVKKNPCEGETLQVLKIEDMKYLQIKTSSQSHHFTINQNTDPGKCVRRNCDITKEREL